MPEISRFLGIIITMYFKDHAPPHFHVKYNEHRAAFSIKDLQLIEGQLPPKIISFILEWAFENRILLQEDWELVSQGKTPNKIPPYV